MQKIPEHVYSKDIKQIYQELNSSKKGLTSQEAKSRLEKDGLNQLPQKKQRPIIFLFIEQFKSALVVILLCAVAISFTVGKILDGSIILTILVLIAGFGFFQELSARKSLNSLLNMQKGTAKVYRDNRLIEIESYELVTGDVIFCEAGDKVPADCRIIEYTRTLVEESQLTGESVPVSKHNKLIDNEKAISDQKNMLFKSTHIAEGNCLAIVTSTAEKTEIGKISLSMQEDEIQQTPLQIKLDKLGQQIGIGVIVVCSILVVIFAIQQQLYVDISLEKILPIMLVAIALAVGAVPEGLPAIVTIALSIGMKRLLKKDALVRNLSSVETLGSCTVICSDKTGTLTKNEMTITKIHTPTTGEISVDGIGYEPIGKLSDKFSNIHFLNCLNECNNATLFQKDNKWLITGDPTEASMNVLYQKVLNKSTNPSKRIDELPFDSNRKLMSVLIKEDKTKNVQYTKGAIDEILKISTHYEFKNKKVKLTETKKKEIIELSQKYSAKALRIIAITYKEIKANKCSEDNLVYLGFVAMIDPEREEVKDAILHAKEAGIRTIMITGDHIITAKAIGKNLGLEGDAIQGLDIDKLDDDELANKIKTTSIFARVSPEHKMRIVSQLQKHGEIVAMTGDGVNDAPALNKANIGVALGSGTDVAKEAGDIVLLKDSFAIITHAIKEGRTIFSNLQKALMFFLSGNISQVLIIFIAVLIGLPLPLTAFMLLWINLVTDGAPALALSVDSSPNGIMKKKPRREKGILDKNLWGYLLCLCLMVVLIGMTLFAYFLPVDVIIAQTVLFTFIVGAKCMIAFFVRVPFKTKVLSNMFLIYAVGISVLLHLTLLLTPLHKFFGLATLTLNEFKILAVAFMGFYITAELVKFMFQKRIDKQ